MSINWSGIGEVFAIGLGATVVVVVMFSFGITALGKRETAAADGQGSGSASGPLAVAALCFLVCAAVVGYGIYLIVAK